MAPRSSNVDILEEYVKDEVTEKKTKGPFLTPIIWRNVLALGFHHLIAFYVAFTFPYIQNYRTVLFVIFYNFFGALGVTAGIHRFFSHKTYKATPLLEIILLIFYAIAGQHTVRRWVRDHRVHHMASDTLGDPYNARRGSFFSHIGWLMVEKHPEFQKHARNVNIEDIINDPIIQIFDRYFFIWIGLFAIAIPIIVPMYFWNETFFYAAQMAILRHVVIINVTFVINGFAHTFGDKTYNTKYQARENFFLSLITNGEGYHNYHHTFPYDYKASEPGKFNVSTYAINLFAKLRMAYDLKEARPENVKEIREKYGSKH